MPSQLPLFPLRTVLFPGALLPLHIFEPRYRELLADVSAGNHRFGILPPAADDGMPDPGAIGTVALLRGIGALPDGRSNIVVSGEFRFVLVDTFPSNTSYFQGLIDPLDDEPDVQVPGADELDRLRALGYRYAQALQQLADEPVDQHFSLDAGALSFEVSALVEGSFEKRQRLLESRSALERVTRLLALLPALVHSAEERAQVHNRAKTNGHGALR